MSWIKKQMSGFLGYGSLASKSETDKWPADPKGSELSLTGKAMTTLT